LGHIPISQKVKGATQKRKIHEFSLKFYTTIHKVLMKTKQIYLTPPWLWSGAGGSVNTQTVRNSYYTCTLIGLWRRLMSI